MKDKFNNAVGPQVHTRGVVATCSYEAKRYVYSFCDACHTGLSTLSACDIY
jgi:hypothetical protein